MNITEQSRLLAEYLGWKYVPSNDLQGFPKAGWWKGVEEDIELFEKIFCTHSSDNCCIFWNVGSFCRISDHKYIQSIFVF